MKLATGKIKCEILKIQQKEASSGTFENDDGEEVAWSKGPHNVLTALGEVIEVIDSKTYFRRMAPLKVLDFDQRPLKVGQTVELTLVAVEKPKRTDWIAIPDTAKGLYSIAYDDAHEDEDGDEASVAPAAPPTSPAPSKKS